VGAGATVSALAAAQVHATLALAAMLAHPRARGPGAEGGAR